MLFRTLHSFTRLLSGHLSRVFGLHEEIVSLGPAENRTGGAMPNKLTVTLVNIERETAAGISFSHRSSGDRFNKQPPDLKVNLYVLVAAIFSDKQYEEGLRLLSSTLSFLRNNSTVAVADTDEKLTLEPVNLSLTELSNLWSVCGGTYHPSVLCKIRVLDLGEGDTKRVVPAITQKETGP